ncbi:hypothetical protein [Bacillus sp. BNPI-92]|uniref:endonuclease domain-containing protein n=1 Tax=Bacillus sp. BNPI-92 TaxID=2610899 RepID=UPI00123DC21B|nr:hypothetical protein [Bacillus sp. BNPI-92]
MKEKYVVNVEESREVINKSYSLYKKRNLGNIMAWHKFLSIRFEMDYKKKYLMYYNDDLESVGELLLYNSLCKFSKGKVKPKVQVSVKCKNGKTYRLDMAYPLGIYKIAVEVDGKDHLNPIQRQKDIIRDQFLRKENVFVIRVTGREVFQDVGVLPTKRGKHTLSKFRHKESRFFLR